LDTKSNIKKSRKNPNSMRYNKNLRVCCSAEEATIIKQNAEEHSLSVSSYLRELGLGNVPKSTIDATCIEELGRINADQARLGNLLKMWLAQEDERRFNAVGENTVKALVDQIKQTQINLNTQIEVLGDLIFD